MVCKLFSEHLVNGKLSHLKFCVPIWFGMNYKNPKKKCALLSRYTNFCFLKFANCERDMDIMELYTKDCTGVKSDSDFEIFGAVTFLTRSIKWSDTKLRPLNEFTDSKREIYF